ncbi:histidinol-phosphate transaminase [Okibacterium endophyticum]
MTSDAQPLDPAPVRLRPEILAAAPYRQGRPAGEDSFKLSSNENPYPPLPSIVDVVAREAGTMNRYPDAGALRLRDALAARHGVSVDEVHVGSGSVALLSQFIAAAAGPGDDVVYSWRSFEAYPGLVTVAGATSVQVDNRPDGGHDLEAMAAAITDSTRAVIVCSPNNPTGTVVTARDFDRFLAKVPGDVLVLLDEAYAEFVTRDDAVNGLRLIGRHPNLVVLRTFSKAYGLAGLRIGWAVGHHRVLDGARAAAIPLSVTGIAQEAAIASLDAEIELLERVHTLAALRDRVRASLTAQGWNVPESQANFIWLATGEQTDAADDTLREAGVVARAFSASGIRVSVGEIESVEKILQATADIVRDLPENHPAKRIA